ncbi:hypothetical protein ABPG73_019132 [Tetrahymena malaccensis]
MSYKINYQGKENQVCYIFLAFNFLIISLIIFELILFIVQPSKNSSKKNGIRNYTSYIISFLLGYYEYCFMIPSFIVSISSSQKIVASINMILTLLIQLSICLNDFSFCIKESNDDCLSRLNCWQLYLIKLLMTIILLFNSQVIKIDIQELITFFYYLIYLITSVYLSQYNYSLIRIADNICSILLSTFSITIFLQRKNQVNISLIVAQLIFLPLSVLLSYLIEKNYLNVRDINVRDFKEDISPLKLIQLCRNIQASFSFSFSKYNQNPNSVALEEIGTQHLQFCTEYPYCFCNYKEESKQDYIDNTINGKNRMLFTQHFVKKQLLNGRNQNLKMRKQSNTNLDLSYCTYLLEVCGSRVQCIYELNKMIFEKRISLREQMYAFYLIERIKESFKNKSNKLDFFEALNYEKIMNLTFNKFEQALQQKFKLYDLINSDQINLISLTLESDKLVELRIQLKTNIIELLRINQNHPAFIYLQQEYIDSFAFLESYSTLIKFAQRLKTRQSKNEIESQKKIQDQAIQNEENIKLFFNFKKEELFYEKSCVLFLRITGNQIGYVVQAQRNFSDLFGYTEIVGQSINAIIPTCISQYHNRHISSYINQVDQLNQQFSGKYIPLQIAINKQGWAVPVSLRMQIEYLADYNELGLSCVIKQYQTDNNFMLLDVESSKIQAISQPFYNSHLSQIFSIKELMQIPLCRIIPALLYLTDKQKFQNLQQLNYIQTFAFLPEKGLTSQIKFSLAKQFNLNKLSKELEEYANKPYLKIYILNFKVSFINEAYQKQCILEIEQFRQITSELEIKEAYQQAQIQFQTIFQIKIPNFIYKSAINPIFEEQLDTPQEQNILNEENQSHSLEIIEDEHHRKLIALQNQMSSHDLEQISFAPQSNYYNLESVKHLDSTPLYQNQIHFQNLNVSKQNLDTDQYEQKGIPQSPCALFSISSPRQNILSNTTLISPRIQKANTSQNNITLSKVKIQSNENLVYSQDFIPGIRDASTLEQNINLSPTKIKSKISEKVEDQLNIWQFDLFNQCHLKPDKIRKIEAEEQLNSNISTLEKRYDSNLKSKIGKMGRLSQNLKEGATTSIKSSISHSTELKRTIYSKIKSTKKGVLITFLNILTIISIIPLITMTLYQYLTMTSQFSLEKTDFQMIPWPMSLRAVLSQNLEYVIFIKFVDSNIFPGVNKKWNDYKLINYQRIQDEINEYKHLYKQFLSSDQQQLTYFQNVTNFKLNFVQMRDQFSQLNQQFNLTMSFQAYINNYFTSVNRLSTIVYNEYNEEGTVLSNFVSFSTQIGTLATNIQKKTRDDLQGIYDQSILVMQVIIILSFIVISGILPANYLIKNQVEEILKLFATIPPQHLQEVLQDLRFSAFKLNSQKSQFTIQYDKKNSKTKNQLQNFTSKLKYENFKQNNINDLKQFSYKQDFSSNLISANQKKKSISLTTTINKLQIKLVVYCLLALIALIIQPITNVILIKSFNDQALINVDLLSTLYDLKAHFCSNQVLNYSYLYYKLIPNNKLYDPNYYKVRIPVFFSLNVKKQTNLNNVVGQQIMTDRYQMNYYNEFLFKILNGNMCEAFRDYPQFYNQTYLNFNFTTCSSLRNSILTKGFQISGKYFLDQFPILYDILSIKDQNVLQKEILIWQQQFDLKEFDEFAYFLIQVITVMKDFLVNRNNDYLNYMITVQTVLLVFQCLALTIVFYFGWYNFYKSITNDLNKSKNYLTLIDIDQIIENPYLMSYINKQK